MSRAWKVADLLGEREAALSLIVLDTPAARRRPGIGRRTPLAEKGALIALHTDDPITDSRLFLRMAAQTVRAGMDPAAALASVTLNPARMLHLEDRVGSLEPGKDADLVVLSGPPLSTWTHIEQTWVEGALVFDRSRPADHRLAVGGDAAASNLGGCAVIAPTCSRAGPRARCPLNPPAQGAAGRHRGRSRPRGRCGAGRRRTHRRGRACRGGHGPDGAVVEGAVLTPASSTPGDRRPHRPAENDRTGPRRGRPPGPPRSPGARRLPPARCPRGVAAGLRHHHPARGAVAWAARERAHPADALDVPYRR